MHREAQELQDPVWDCTLIAQMRKHGSCVVNPIYYWQDTDIWDYIHQENMEVNPLYAKGYERVGCIGCPLAGKYTRKKEFEDYPKYKQLYINAFEKMLARNAKRGKKYKHVWESGEEVFNWWIEDDNVAGQISMFDKEE